MKCIYCNTDNDLKTRTERKYLCSGCNHLMAFEPTSDPLKVTDKLFQQVLTNVSAKGKLHFTERQSWYEFNRHVRNRSWWKKAFLISFAAAAAAVLLLALGIVVGVFVLGFFTLVYLGVGTVQFLRHRTTLLSEPSFDAFRSRYFARWERVHGPIPGLVRLQEQEPVSMPGREPDLYSYSFDRVVVADKPEVAAMLVANNFHFENNCAVMSEHYPPGMKETLLTMLRRNPQLAVFAVHDASADGCELPIELRKRNWFADEGTKVFDTGLRPRQAQKLKIPKLEAARRALSTELRGLLKPDEVNVLESGDKFELEALRPSKLMRTLYKYLNESRKAEAATAAAVGGGLAPIFFIEFGTEIGGGDDGDADGDGGDSFG